jgi:hypothetical protein
MTDRGGASRNATQATGANQPVFRTNIVNGKPVYRFNGTTSTASFGDVLTGLTAAEVFLVHKPTGTTVQGGIWDMGGAAVTTYIPFTDGKVYDGFGSTTRATGTTPPKTLANFSIHNVSTAAGSWTARQDGTVFVTQGTNTVAWPTAPMLGQNHALNFYPGDIAEFIVYSTVLSSGDRAVVHSYLGSKYGITIP